MRHSGSREGGSRLKLRISYRKVAPLRVSHRGPAGWTPPPKDADFEPTRRDGRETGRRRG